MRNIHFLCSPSLAILDNWLPVLTELKVKLSDYKFVLVIPKAGIVEHISDQDLTIQLSKEIFDEVVFLTHANRWKKVKRIDEAVSINSRSRLRKNLADLASRLIRRIPLVSFKPPPSRGLNIVEELKQTSALLFDVHEEAKDFNSFLVHIPDVKKFSIFHGVNIDTGPYMKRTFRERTQHEVTAFLFSAAEKEYYQTSYSLSDSDLRIVGIPRHEPRWIAKIQNNHGYQFPDWNKSILLISRSLSPYFPYERKKEALENIKRLVVDELGMKVIIKRHPKEPNDGLFDTIFGKENEGRTWFATRAHPFIISQRCVFAISFYSGVCADMTNLGVPTIEYLDLKGLEGFDNSAALRDSHGEPVFSYRYLGLVRGVSDYQSFKSAVDELLADRASFLEPFKERYHYFFGSAEGSIEKVTSEIISSISREGRNV